MEDDSFCNSRKTCNARVEQILKSAIRFTFFSILRTICDLVLSANLNIEISYINFAWIIRESERLKIESSKGHGFEIIKS